MPGVCPLTLCKICWVVACAQFPLRWGIGHGIVRTMRCILPQIEDLGSTCVNMVLVMTIIIYSLLMIMI
jgi:hypothetical protein